MTSTDPSTDTRRVFIIRPWSNPAASLYPPTMDGVEYIGSVLKVIKRAFDPGRFDVRFDEEVFIPGLTLRQNLERELVNAEIVIAILDGLRPNVVYELGFAFGYREGKQIGPDEPDRHIFCLAEKDATVLVRNYYPDPLAVPTTTGTVAKILNPRLNVCSSFSDNSDLLILHYDRLDLDGTLLARLTRLANDVLLVESKQFVAAEGAATETVPDPPEAGQQEDRLQRLWDLYRKRQYADVISTAQSPDNAEEKKVVALALMKTGRIFEATQLWRELVEIQSVEASALFHLGVCHYVMREFEKAAFFFERAQAVEGNSTRVRSWIDRTRQKLSPKSWPLPNVEPAQQTQQEVKG